MAWGYHLSLNCYECDSEAIKNYNTVYDFTKELVEAIDMIAYGEPQIVHFGEGDKEGFTMIQLIETSNICAHFVNDTNAIYLDVFSCKNFDPQVVEKTVRKYFIAPQMMARFIERE